MFRLEINGEPFPAPTEYMLGTEPVGRFERNANGALVGDLTAVKTKLSCRWGILSGTDYARLLTCANAYFVPVTYTSADGGVVTKEMAVQLQDASLKLHQNTEGTHWSGAACTLTER